MWALEGMDNGLGTRGGSGYTLIAKAMTTQETKGESISSLCQIS